MGNPLGELGGTVTDGIISALDREAVSYTHLDVYKRQIHTFRCYLLFAAEQGRGANNGGVGRASVEADGRFAVF